MKSSIDSGERQQSAASDARRISGKRDFQNVRNGGARGPAAASSSVQSNPRTRARTVSATKLT